MKRLIFYIYHHYKEIYKISLFIISIAAIVYIFPGEARFKYEFQQGKPWQHNDLYAPTSFPVLKPEGVLEQERSEVLSDLRPYFTYNPSVYPENRSDLTEEFYSTWQSTYNEDPYQSDDYQRDVSFLLHLYDSVGNRGVIDNVDSYRDQYPGNTILLVRNHFASEVRYSDLFTRSSAMAFITRSLEGTPYDSSLIVSVISPYLHQNVTFDAAKTEAERKNLLSTVSLTHRMVQKGELVIAHGQPVDRERYQVLVSLRHEYEESPESSLSINSIVAGQIILVSITILMLVLFLYHFWPQVFDNNRKVILILLLLILMVFLTNWITSSFSSSLIYLLPVCIVPIVIRAFFDTRLALFVHLITIILISFIVPNSFEYIFLQLIAGIITILTIMNLQKRSQFFITSVFIFLSYSVTYIGMTLLTLADFSALEPVQFALFAGSALITLFAYPLVYIFEKLLGLITDVSLMEYSDSNSKLLRQLADKAPGTFQHSLQVANMSELVIHKIGGSALLVRTGALYHDIGKMKNPMYFIENQSGGYNPHRELSNKESAKVLLNHVLDGIELAKKHKLPEQIIDFIRTHHGTKKMEYFYRQEVNENPSEQVDDKDFRYPGPEPFSRETAVVMMADSVEAASRSIKEPGEKALSQLVDKIIDGQMAEKQFYNANITFAEINETRKILKRKLFNIYHIRIEYPD